GTYTLTVTNTVGCTGTTNAVVVTVITPSIPSSLSTSSIQLDRATMNWGAVTNANHYDLRIRAQGTNTWQLIQNVTTNSRTKTGLNSSTTYEWEVRSACSSDSSSVSAWTATQTFTTLTPCTTPTNPTTSNITTTQATLSWDAVSGWGYTVRYKSSGSWVIDTVNTNSLALTGLTAGTSYRWQVKAICDSTGINNSSWATQIIFNTISPCSAPTNLSVVSSSITSSSAKLKWIGTYGCHSYTLIYRVSGSASWDTLTITNTFIGSSAEYILTGLTSGSTYEWKVSTNCVAGGSNSSSFASGSNFNTTAACIVPSGLSTTNIMLDRATMNWSSTSNAHHYDIRIRNQGGSWTWLGYIFSTTKTKYNLSSGTTYEWQVRGVCSSDTSEVSSWSATETFTIPGPCTVPTNPTTSNIGTTTADLSWDAVSGAWGYRVMYLKLGAAWNTKVIDTVNTNLNSISGLDIGTQYRWRVKGICLENGSNNSSWTGWQVFSTLSGSRITSGDTSLTQHLNIYPNPNRGIFNISFLSEEIDNFTISVVDAFGKIVNVESKSNFIGEYTKQIDLSNYTKGIYMIQIRTTDSFISKRVIIQ
ncbi:MAG: fibronectin type III domain-containing protein, partial [Bacteroidota bacterium]|nr:fibronectin type III domain-containing protein [Bacteroidota bacterium]